MSYTTSVGAPQYAQMNQPVQAPMQAPAAAPTSGPTYATDAYRTQLAQPQRQMQAAAPVQPKSDYKVISGTDVAIGAAGAVGGFFLAGMIGLSGPIGALILGLALFGISAGVRALKNNSDKKKQQQQMQPVHPGFQQQQPQFQNRYNYQQQAMPPQQYAYPPQQAAPQMQQNMQYAQAYQQRPGQMPPQQPGAYPGAYPQQNQSMWDKFLSWL